jgi:lipoyl-dependent peroxiredoxin
MVASGASIEELEVELQISLPSITDEQAVALVTAAHQVCPYSNATRGNVDVTLVVNGVPL